MRILLMTLLLSGVLSGCTHKVELAAKQPITINMNLKIDHQVRVQVDEQLEQAFDQDSDIF